MLATLDIDADVLASVTELAQREGRSAGAVLSDLARRALDLRGAPRVRNGVTLFPRRSGTPSMELVNRLRDDE